jgi:type VI secretion system protein ImpF
MAETLSRDRLQPSLLDRLTDLQPTHSRETVAERVLTRSQLRAAVLRDLSWLFNAIRPEPEPASTQQEALALWRGNKHASRSVLNFGMPDFAGSTKSSFDRVAMEAAIKQAITTFEPRIDAKSLSVSIQIDHRYHHNTMQLTIRGQLWAQPVPLELLLGADIDLETGSTRMREMRN